MIVKNEEEVLDRCLEPIKDVIDEIIIVDTGSGDKTKEIAAKYTNKIFEFTWIDDFSAARNVSFDKATMEYIMWLDADDVFLEEDVNKLKNLKENLDTSINYATMIYNLDFDELGNVKLSNRRVRLVKKENNYKWCGAVHEYIDIRKDKNSINSDVCVTHKKLKPSGDRNIEIYRKKMKEGEEFSPRDYHCYANELAYRKYYKEAIEGYEKFLDLEWSLRDKITACSSLADCYFAIKDIEKAKMTSLRSFLYGTPRAEQCCKLGFYFFTENNLDSSVYWYKAALELEKPDESWELINDACWTWLPHLQLSLCYMKSGDYELARQHNEKVKEIRPDDKTVALNDGLIEKLIKLRKDKE
jgi:glycosyltransferase involved in cell wall biosynthesis